MHFWNGGGKSLRRRLGFPFPFHSAEWEATAIAGIVLKKIIRPALLRAGIRDKVIGWHSFRHSLATSLRSLGVDIKTAQELMRHANSRITLDICTQGISSERRLASGRLMKMPLPEKTALSTSAP